jgi:predicted PurR-regulated permease PerM
MPGSRPIWSPRVKLTVTLLLLGLSIFLLYIFRAAITPFIIAVLLAFILNPIATWIEEQLKLRRVFATMLAYLFFLVIVSILPLVIIPPLISQWTALSKNFSLLIEQAESLLGQSYTIAGFSIDPQQAVQSLVGSLQGLLQPAFSQTLRYVMDILSSLVWVVFVLVISFYFVKDSRYLSIWMETLPPPSYRKDYVYLRNEINLVWNSFLRGQLSLALLVAVIFTTVGLIIGLPFAFAMGVFAGMMEFIPSIGHGIWLTVALLLSFFAGSTWLPMPHWLFALLVLLMHLFYEQFDLNYLIPRIVGRRVQLPPVVVILGIVTGMLTAGVLGVVLAAPTIATGRVILRYFYANLLDEDPFPGTVAPPLPAPNSRWWYRPYHHLNKNNKTD